MKDDCLTKDDYAMIEMLALRFYDTRDLAFTKAIRIAFLAGKQSGLDYAKAQIRDMLGKAA